MQYGHSITEAEIKRNARYRVWRTVQYVVLVLLAAAAGTISFIALFRQY